MDRLQLCVDGSCIKVPAQKQQFVLGWGLVAASSRYTGERTGAVAVPFPYNRYHETLAVVEGVLLAHELGYAPENTSLRTDDEMLGYANTFLHPGNARMLAAEHVRDSVMRVCEKFYNAHVAELTLRYLRVAQVEKLRGHGRGHRRFVEHTRADVLARQSAQLEAGLPLSEPLSEYEEWLQLGPQVFDYEIQEKVREPLPFCAPGLPVVMPLAA